MTQMRVPTEHHIVDYAEELEVNELHCAGFSLLWWSPSRKATWMSEIILSQGFRAFVMIQLFLAKVKQNITVIESAHPMKHRECSCEKTRGQNNPTL